MGTPRSKTSNTARPRSALVLGASGFVGRWVARRLTAAGSDLHLAVRDPERARRVFDAYGVRGTVEAVDLREPGRLRDLVERIRPDTVFNLAGYAIDRDERDEATAFAVNRDLVETLCEILLGMDEPHAPALVHVGSAEEYGKIAGDLDEASEPRPETLYGRSKLAGTRWVEAARRAGLRALTARLFSVYGPGEHANRLFPTLIAARDGTGRIPLTEGLQRRDLIFVDDVAEGLVRLAGAIDRCAPTVNVASGRLHSIRDFVEIIADEVGIDRARLGFGDLPGRAGEMQHEPVSVGRLRDALDGWTPATTPRDGVRATLAFTTSTDTLPS